MIYIVHVEEARNTGLVVSTSKPVTMVYRFGSQNQRLRFASLALKISSVGLPVLASKPVVAVDGGARGVITEVA